MEQVKSLKVSKTTHNKIVRLTSLAKILGYERPTIGDIVEMLADYAISEHPDFKALRVAEKRNDL